MEQATAGKAPPPIAINSGGGIQILNMNAVRAAAVGATVVPSPGSAQNATVVGSPGPPGKAVGQRMIHFTPQMLAAANARPGAPGEESDFESVKSCDEPNSSNTVQTCSIPPSASNTGVSSDLLPCDNNVDDDECEEGEIRDSDDDNENSVHESNHSTSDDHQISDKASDNHNIVESKSNASENDLINNPNEITGNEYGTVLGSSVILNERSDASPLFKSSPSCPSPPPEPDPFTDSPCLVNEDARAGQSQSDKQTDRDAKAFKYVVDFGVNMDCDTENRDYSLDLGSHSRISSSNVAKCSSEGARKVDNVGTLDRENCKKVVRVSLVGAHEEIELERNSVEDRQNNNSDSVASGLRLYKNGNDVPVPENNATPEEDSQRKTEERTFTQNQEQEPSPSGPCSPSNQSCVQDKNNTNSNDESSGALISSGENKCDNDTVERSESNIRNSVQIEKNVSSVLVDVTKNDLLEAGANVSSTVPEDHRPNLICDRNSESVEDRGLQCSSSSAVPAVVDDLNLDVFSNPSQAPPSKSSDSNNFVSTMESVESMSRFEVNIETRPNLFRTIEMQEKEENKAQREKEKANDIDDNRPQPQLMDMNLADYIFMDIDEDNGHRPWNSIQNASKLPHNQNQRRPSQELPTENVPPHPQPDNLSSVEIRPPISSPPGMNQVIANKHGINSSSNLNQAPRGNPLHSSCAFQMYTIGQGQSHSQPEIQGNVGPTSTHHPRIAARIPQRNNMYSDHHHPSYNSVRQSQPQSSNYHQTENVSNAGIITEKSPISGSTFPPNNRANLIANNSFSSTGESEYKASHSQQHRYFTTDPQLHSQFLQFTQNYPMSQDKNVSASSSIGKFPTPGVTGSGGTGLRPQFQHHHESQGKSFPSRPVPIMGQTPRQSVIQPQQPSHPQTQQTASSLNPTGSQNQNPQQSPYSSVQYYHRDTSTSLFQPGSSQSHNLPTSLAPVSANGCDNNSNMSHINKSVPYQTQMGTMTRMTDFTSSRFSSKYGGSNQSLPQINRQTGPRVPGAYYQSQGASNTIASPPHAQPHSHQPQQQRQINQQQPQSIQKEYSSCSYDSSNVGGVSSSRLTSSSVYPTASQLYLQHKYGTPTRTSSSSGSHPTVSPNFSGNFNYSNSGRMQAPSTRPTMPQQSHPHLATSYRTPAPGSSSSSMSGTDSWNTMPVATMTSAPTNVRPTFSYPTQNLGRPEQPQTVDKVPYQHQLMQPGRPPLYSVPQDQRRTMSVIAAPRYPATGSGSSVPYRNPVPYTNSATSQLSNQQRLHTDSSSSSMMMTSPPLVRNSQYAAHYKSTSSVAAFEESSGPTSSSSGASSSVIRPNIYSGGNISTLGNNASGASYSTQNNTSSGSNRQAYVGSAGNNYYSGAVASNSSNQASVICGPQNSNSREQTEGSTYSGVGKNYQPSTSLSPSSSSGYYSGEMTLQSFLSHPSAPFLCPTSLSTADSTSPSSTERSGTSGSGYYGNERVWERPYTARGDQSTDQEQYPFSSCQYSDAMRRYNAPFTLQALSGLPPGANHLLVKTENGQFQLVSVRMQSPTAAAAAPGTPVVPSTAAPPTSMSIAQQLPSNSPLPPPPHSSGSLAPPISSSIITTTTIPPHLSQQGRIITSSSSNHIGTSWSSSNNNSLVNNNSTTSSSLPIITSSAAHAPPHPHLVPPLPSSHPSPHPTPSVPSSVIMPPNLSASNSQLLISTANNISSSTSSSTFSTAAQAAVAAAQAAYNQHRAPHPVVMSSVPPPGGPPGPPVGAHPPPSMMNSIPPGASVIRTGVIGSSSLPPPPPPIVVSTATNSPAPNSSVSSVVITSTPNSNLPAAAPQGAASFRPQSNTSSQLPNNNATNNAQQSSGMRMMMSASNSMSSHPLQHHQIHPPYSQLHSTLPPTTPYQAPFASNTSASNTTANTVSQMSNETAKNKCKNFLSFLLELSAKQNQNVARSVKNLIQGLIDGKVNEENFADRLQKEVNSQPQPCLVGFLKKSLPHLRHSLATSELKIEGIKPPPLSTFVPPAPVSALVPQTPTTPTPTETRKKPSKQTPPVRPTTPTVPPPVRILTPPVNSASPSITPPTPVSVSASGGSAPLPTAASPSSSKSSKPSKGGSSKSKASAASSNALAGTANSSSGPGGTPSTKSSIPSQSKSGKEKEKKDKTFSSSGYSADDDINDVAAMGGVNLAEESQRILGSTEYVGTQIRSCRDETLIQASPISAKFKVIAAKYGLDETPVSEVSALLSHAVEERLKTMIEKLSVIAEHRMDVIKLDERYEVTQDVKGQLRFLEELDKLEKKRHDEQEREILLRAAKSRSKSEDPEQAKLKAKAKEMQRVQLEEMRQRDANLTALQAIGPRKKPKLDIAGGSHSSAVPSPLGATGASSSLGRPQMALRPRLKRVNLRDLLFLLEHDKETMRSPFLYKNLLLK